MLPGNYEIAAINSQGMIKKLHVTPTGTILDEPKSTVKDLTALEAVKKVEAAGYSGIYKVDAEGNDTYEVKALSKEGKKVELDVASPSGKITKKWLG